MESERTGLDCSEDLALATYHAEWLRLWEKTLKPTTFAHYRDHVHTDLIPSFGRLPLTDLRARNITAWSEAELARGRGRTAVYRIGATFSSALSHAVRTRDQVGIIERCGHRTWRHGRMHPGDAPPNWSSRSLENSYFPRSECISAFMSGHWTNRHPVDRGLGLIDAGTAQWVSRPNQGPRETSACTRIAGDWTASAVLICRMAWSCRA
ncbi:MULTISPECIES: N-terminal phage integrase SAM-like domain-containing protein [Streptomyces]|uniref:N-terminal phage integrase SAM-like domain-containing protein n=1 Tax=Streptomyces TaxID=1883 RepID=UPI00099773AA